MGNELTRRLQSAADSYHEHKVRDLVHQAPEVELVVKLPEPIHGFWDGGAKDRFTFRIDCGDRRTKTTRLGSWEANHYRWVRTGATVWKTFDRLKRIIRRNCRRAGVAVEFWYEEVATGRRIDPRTWNKRRKR